MNLGITVRDDELLLAIHNGPENDTDFKKYHLHVDTKHEQMPDGFIWDLAGEYAEDFYRRADHLVLSIPSPICLVKRLVLDQVLLFNDPKYGRWIASLQLPGNLEEYRFGFIPLRSSFNETQLETLFYASPEKLVKSLIYSLKRENDRRDVILFPEQLGLLKILGDSIALGEYIQGAIINCGYHRAEIVIYRDGGFYHCKNFIISGENEEDIEADITTYLYSKIDNTEPLPVLITGSNLEIFARWLPRLATDINPHFLEFASARGVIEHHFENHK